MGKRVTQSLNLEPGNFQNPKEDCGPQCRPSAPSQAQAPAGLGSPHLGVLVGGHGNKLGFLESEDMRVGRVAGGLWLAIVDLHDVQPGLVLMEGLQHDHLEREPVAVGRGGSSMGPLPLWWP